MKTQQRRFVVEIKGARRKVGAPQPSIWGNADLKALAREAAAEAGDLFAPIGIEQPDFQEAVKATEANFANPTEAVRDDNQLEHLPVVDGPRDDEANVEPIAVRAFVGEIAETVLATPRTEVRQKQKGRPITRSSSHKQVTSPDEDELAALDEENRRLRAALRDRLLGQNRQILAMLGRYGAKS